MSSRNDVVVAQQINNAIGVSALAAIPYVGWALAAGAAILNGYVITPALTKWANKRRGDANTDDLLGVPIGTNEPGGPRIYALGSRVRVPTHVLWQDRKVREPQVSTNKSGTTTTLRRTQFDALIAVNDRFTQSLNQLVGNGALMIFQTRNLVDIVSHDMIVSVAGANLKLAMPDSFSPSFKDKFVVGDVVKLSNFVVTAGNNINNDYWKVAVVTDHSASTPSYVELSNFWQQTVAGIVATAGTVFSPGTIVRVDDRLFPRNATYFNFTQEIHYQDFESHIVRPSTVFAGTDKGTASGIVTASLVFANGVQGEFKGEYMLGSNWVARFRIPGPADVPTTNVNSGGHPAFVANTSGGFASALFPDTFDPVANFYQGHAQAQENNLLVAVKGTGNVPAYRGIAYQALDSFFASDFGDQLPWALEAIIQPDISISWGQALIELLSRGGIPLASMVASSALNQKSFYGGYVRGDAPTATAIQPFLLASQTLTQERAGTLNLFTVDEAEIIGIRNDADVSDMAAEAYSYEDEQDANLPTFMGVRHQDPDNGYADGFQPFGLRTPSTPENSGDINLRNVVLSRKQARELGQTLTRRAHVNSRRYTVQLPPSYLDALENDLIQFTDRDGEVVTARIMQRDIGSDYVVRVVCVREMVGAAVAGGGVDSGAGQPPPSVPSIGAVTAVAIDCPAITTAEGLTPGIKLAACTSTDAGWGGCSVWESTDGSSWTSRGTITTQAGIGQLAEAMDTGPSAEAYGTTTIVTNDLSIDVDFICEGAVGIEDASLTDAINGKNWCAIIDANGEVEIAAFQTQTFVSGITYTLGSWLRGLRGTSPVAHTIGARIVLLSPAYSSGVGQLDYPGLNQPTSLAYKLVPAGQSLDSTPAIQIVAAWKNARPLPVRSVSKTIGSTPFDARFTINANWCRQVLPLGTQPPHPMDEISEGYKLTIYDPTGTIARRTKTIQASASTGAIRLRDRWFDYPASEQTTDGYTPSAIETFWIDVQQIGSFGLSPSIKQEV